MMSVEDKKALAELTRIVARYGPEPLTRLAGFIRDPQNAEEIASVLESVAAQAHRNKATPKSRKTDGIGMAVLNDLKESDPQKYAAMADFRERLVSGTFLHSMNEIRQFARINDFTIGKAASRNAAIPPLLRSVSELDTPAIVALLDSMPESGYNDRSLERWRELIVRPKSLPSRSGQ